jgi:hypothetical protein
MTELLQAVGAGTVAGAIVIACGWLLKETIARALARSVNRDLELLKSELGRELEKLRHHLEREALKAELLTTRRHEVYAQIVRSLRVAESAVMALAPPKQELGMGIAFALPRMNWSAPPDLIGNADAALEACRSRAKEDSLYLSENVRKLLDSAITNMASAVECVRPLARAFHGPETHLGRIAPNLSALEKAMRSEIEPSDPEPTVAGSP